MYRSWKPIGIAATGVLLAACNVLTVTDDPPPRPGVACTLIACGHTMVLKTQVTASIEELSSSTLTICLNDFCHSLSLQELSKNARAHYPMEGGVVDGNPSFDVLITSMSAGGFIFEVDYTPWFAWELANGDTYAITVQTPEGRHLVEVRRSVNYVVSQPNGPNCGPVCRLVRLE
jgi:hypothetical protein